MGEKLKFGSDPQRLWPLVFSRAEADREVLDGWVGSFLDGPGVLVPKSHGYFASRRITVTIVNANDFCYGTKCHTRTRSMSSLNKESMQGGIHIDRFVVESL